MNKNNKHAEIMENVVMAGFPSVADNYASTPLDLNELLVRRPSATFFVRAMGESMIDAGINSGDILVVDRSLDATDGNIVIACIQNEFTVKYFRKNNNEIWLEPANKSFKPIMFEDGMQLQIFGVVTAVIHQFVK
ncbi:MAG: translesion error-prone DNA polymerase V autoproteolytic subunit [Verrucomicrobiaceae bacterium]|jgi:DNA polymerase V|nr:translesion error-prone DNA polymerase V autoproteolytic subunit [Verrucomicrobiaceae bacterium]